MLRSRIALLVVLLVAGCGGVLAEGKADFKKGRYAEARETFVAAEPESRNWEDKRRAEYALYRGLTHGALGDRAAAGVWLHEAKAIEDAHPATLSADDITRLKLGLEAIDPSQAPAAP